MEKSAALCLIFEGEAYEPHETRIPILKKNGGTILAIGASVGVVLTAIETGKASTKAQKLIEKNTIAIDCENYGPSAYTTEQKVKDCWKFYRLPLHLAQGLSHVSSAPMH